jgi:hypothetical protein
MSRCLCWSALAVGLSVLSVPVDAATIVGQAGVPLPQGQSLNIAMRITDTTTRFELTGPDFSWFAFAFDTTTMRGYALIVQGLDAARTVTEQNLVGIGNPGSPQPLQNINLMDTVHNAANNTSMLILERANSTADPNDAVFSPSLTALNLVWAYDASASPSRPNGNLAYHGSGRGTTRVTFQPEVVLACGDLDQDQDVDSADLLPFLENWTGSLNPNEGSSTFAMGDCDADRDVDTADLLQFVGNWTGSSGVSRAVPEPSCGMGPAIGLVGSLLTVRVRRTLRR